MSALRALNTVTKTMVLFLISSQFAFTGNSVCVEIPQE